MESATAVLLRLTYSSPLPKTFPIPRSTRRFLRQTEYGRMRSSDSAELLVEYWITEPTTGGTPRLA